MCATTPASSANSAKTSRTSGATCAATACRLLLMRLHVASRSCVRSASSRESSGPAAIGRASHVAYARGVGTPSPGARTSTTGVPATLGNSSRSRSPPPSNHAGPSVRKNGTSAPTARATSATRSERASKPHSAHRPTSVAAASADAPPRPLRAGMRCSTCTRSLGSRPTACPSRTAALCIVVDSAGIPRAGAHVTCSSALDSTVTVSCRHTLHITESTRW